MFKVFLFLFIFVNSATANEINLFTSRHYESDAKLFKKFTDQTGIKINIISGKSKVLEKRIFEEGNNSKADILFLADAGALYSAQNKNLFSKIKSEFIKKKVPISLRNDFWVGITKRSRILYYNPNFLSKKEIEDISYEDLSDKKWLNSIAVRQSNNIYNQSLVASMLEHNGVKNTKKWLEGLVNNFARSPQGNDRAQILMVASGEAKLAIANSYYYALMLSGKKGIEQKKAAEKVIPIFPNQLNRGAHINISGAGIIKFSKNKKKAEKFLEFLLTNDSQSEFCSNSFEYPVIDDKGVDKPEYNLSSNFKEDTSIDVSIYGKRQAEAFKLMKKAGWN